MSTLAFPAHRGRSGAARPHTRRPSLARSRETRHRPAAGLWPAWTDEVRICVAGPESAPIEPALFWADGSDESRYAVALPPKGR